MGHAAVLMFGSAVEPRNSRIGRIGHSTAESTPQPPTYAEPGRDYGLLYFHGRFRGLFGAGSRGISMIPLPGPEWRGRFLARVTGLSIVWALTVVPIVRVHLHTLVTYRHKDAIQLAIRRDRMRGVIGRGRRCDQANR